MQNEQNILIVGDFSQHLQFLQLNIEWVIVVDKEHLEFFGQEQRSFLENQVDSLKD